MCRARAYQLAARLRPRVEPVAVACAPQCRGREGAVECEEALYARHRGNGRVEEVLGPKDEQRVGLRSLQMVVVVTRGGGGYA